MILPFTKSALVAGVSTCSPSTVVMIISRTSNTAVFSAVFLLSFLEICSCSSALIFPSLFSFSFSCRVSGTVIVSDTSMRFSVPSSDFTAPQTHWMPFT